MGLIKDFFFASPRNEDIGLCLSGGGALGFAHIGVLQSLESLGAGFQLASHDLDIRGSGNLLGDEQSGHIKEVGFELYQSMLEEAILEAKAGGLEARPEQFSPQINVDAPILIPEAYVPDLDLRMGLYRRLNELGGAPEIEGFAAELIDRFGPVPAEAEVHYTRNPGPLRRGFAGNGGPFRSSGPSGPPGTGSGRRPAGERSPGRRGSGMGRTAPPGACRPP